jgi:WD40 repeat protein
VIGGVGHAFSSDGRMLMVQDDDLSIRLVETETGRKLARLSSPDMCGVNGAVFSPDDSRLVISTQDGPAVHIWDLRAIGNELQAMGLEWELPSFSEPEGSSPPGPLHLVMDTAAIRKAPLSWTIDTPFKAVAPTLDGRIGPDEYGLPVEVRFDDGRNPGVFWSHSPARSKTLGDYSYRMHTAYTTKALYVTFEVRDQDVRVNSLAARHPHLNDSVELFIDADQVANDLSAVDRAGNREGFQIICDADGHRYTSAANLTNADWKATSLRVSGGYVIEFEIPLGSMDTQDGAGWTPPKAGDVLRFNVGGNDVDEGSSNYLMLWSEDTSASPYMGGEEVWTVGLRLVP